jgi:enoyl-CoA hydratase/carnithine racemase
MISPARHNRFRHGAALAKSLEAVAFTRHQDTIMPFTHLDIGGPVATLSLDHPGGNRINFDMRVELREAVQLVEKSPARALLIRGEGRDFCLGGDVRDWPGVPTEVLRPKIQVFAEALDHLERLSLPTIAAVQGGCMGGGFELALSCDLILAAKSARFAFPEARLGIVTLQGGMMQIAERVGRAKAAEIVFLSEPATAEQMRRWNVVNRVVEDTDLKSEAAALAARLADGPTKAFAATKALWRLQAEQGVKAAKAKLYDLSMPLFETQDARTAQRNAADAINAGQPFPTAAFIGR